MVVVPLRDHFTATRAYCTRLVFDGLAVRFVLGKELRQKFVERFDIVRIALVPELAEFRVIHEFFVVLFYERMKLLVPHFASEP
jgi:hypothetical protein